MGGIQNAEVKAKSFTAKARRARRTRKKRKEKKFIHERTRKDTKKGEETQWGDETAGENKDCPFARLGQSVAHMSSLANSRGFRTALVTGASSGLGLAFARMLREEGLEVWATSRDAGRIPAAEKFHAVALDLHEGESLRAAVAQVRKEAGVPDVLVNNAGAGVFSAFARFPEAEIGRQLRLMLEGPMALTREFWPEMLARKRGVVVNVASLAAEFPLPCLSVYSAAKGGLSAFTRALMSEAHGKNVQVVDFQPGDYQTEFDRATVRPAGGEAWEERVAGRYGELMKNGPLPERAAKDLRRALAGGRSGTVATGLASQAIWAPLGQRIFGQRLFRWGFRRYCGIQEQK
jgi:short-subunit dehydrogenase